MRVVLDARYIGPAPSGIGTYIQALMNRLPALGPEDHFRFWMNPRAPSRFPSAANVELIPVAAPANGIRSLLRPASLDRLARDQVAHFPANLLGRGIPCATVVTVHDVMWLDHPEYIEPGRVLQLVRQAYFGTGIRRALAQATRVITVSHASADRILEVMPAARHRLRVTQHACESHFRPADDPERARAAAARLLGSDGPYFLVVGRNQPSKGHAAALRAFARAGKPHERLVLGQRQHPRRGLGGLAVELDLGDRLLFPAALGPEEIVTLMQGATALLQPSLAEGFGLPALEAMACGCPVIASDIPPLREVLGGAGLLVPPGDPMALAAALRRVGDDPVLRGELRQCGVERAAMFSWDRTARETLDIYREAAREGPGSAT